MEGKWTRNEHERDNLSVLEIKNPIISQNQVWPIEMLELQPN